MPEFMEHAEHTARLYLKHIGLISNQRGYNGWVENLEWDDAGDFIDITVAYSCMGSMDYDSCSMPADLLWTDDFEARCQELKEEREAKKKREEERRKREREEETRRKELTKLAELKAKYEKEV